MKVKRDLTELKKALDEAAAGSILEQPEVDKVIQSLIEENRPLRQNLPRKSGNGQNWIVNRRTVNPTGSWVNDTETPSDTESTYTQTSFPYKTVLAHGVVTRKLIRTGASYADIKAEEINACLDTVADAEEYAIINGSIASNAKQPDGLRILIPSGQRVTAGVNGAPLTGDMMDEAMDLCLGMPTLIICSRRSRRQINGLISANQRFVDKTEVKGGFKVSSWNDVPIFQSQWVADDQTQGTATNASDIFFVNGDKFWVGVLTELHQELLAKTTSQNDQFDILEDVVNVMANTVYHSRILGVIPA